MPDDDMFSWGDSVFNDEHVLELDYLPEAFLHRDEQMETLKYALRPAVRGSRPLDVMARGPPGTGKTTAVQKLFDELTSVSDVDVVRVNCQVDSTRYAVFSRLFEGLFRYEPPSSGISFKRLFAQITNHLIEEGEVLVVALDDVNYLFYEDEADDTLYSLLRAHEAHSEAKVGVIVISSDLDLDIIDELDSRVESVFSPEETYFHAYEKDEISEILQLRVERGFKEGAIGTRVVDQIAEYTESSGGDLRVGIDLLRRSGLNAEMRGSTTVSTDDVEEAYQNAKLVYLRRQARGLSGYSRRLFRIICIRNKTNEKTTKGTIRGEFVDSTDAGGDEFLRNLETLEQLGLVTVEDAENGSGTSGSEVKPAFEPDEVLDIL